MIYGCLSRRLPCRLTLTTKLVTSPKPTCWSWRRPASTWPSIRFTCWWPKTATLGSSARRPTGTWCPRPNLAPRRPCRRRRPEMSLRFQWSIVRGHLQGVSVVDGAASRGCALSQTRRFAGIWEAVMLWGARPLKKGWKKRAKVEESVFALSVPVELRLGGSWERVKCVEMTITPQCRVDGTFLCHAGKLLWSWCVLYLCESLTLFSEETHWVHNDFSIYFSFDCHIFIVFLQNWRKRHVQFNL